MVEAYDILEDIHKQKAIAITKGYMSSSLVLALDEVAWNQVRKHPEYSKYVHGNEIMGMDWILVIDKKISDYYVEILVRIGAAHHVERHDLSFENGPDNEHDQIQIQEP